MKTGNSIEGGSLIKNLWSSFANYHVKFIQEYAKNGIPISYSTIQNEPQNSAHFPTMLMSATDQRDFIKVLGPIFQSNNIKSKVLVMDHNWDMDNYVTTILSDAVSRKYVAGTAYHCYNGDPSAQDSIHNAYPDLDIFFTECSGGTWAPVWRDNLISQTESLYIKSVKYWSRGIIHWNIALDPKNGPFIQGGCGTCRGIVTINSDGTYRREVEYYVIGHNSKFVDVGAARIASSSSNESSILTMAYKNPNGKIVLIVLNLSGNQINLDINWNNQYATYTAPGASVTTLVW